MFLLRSHLLRPCTRYLSGSAVTLSGHNKWSKIKEGKGANDKLKSKIYGRANREILLAARSNSADPTLNSALATAISKAKSNGVPKANIQAALEQAQKSKGNDAGKEFQYEALFAGKVGLIIDGFSDNIARTLRELKDTIREHGAQLSAISYMFEKKGLIQVSLHSDQSFEELWYESVNYGVHDVRGVKAEDAEAEQRIVEITIPPENLEGLTEQLGQKYNISKAEIMQVPLDTGATVDDETREAVRAFIEEVEENPDVHRIRVSPEL